MSVEALVDTHAHIFKANLPMDPHGLHLPRHDFTVEDYLAILDAHGVVNASIAAPSFLGSYNDYMIRDLIAHPRLRGTAILEPDTSPYDMRQMDKEGVIGVRLSLRGRRDLPDFTTVEYQRFFYRLADLGWHAHLHIEGERLPQVLPILQKMPMNLIVDHMGRPDPIAAENSEGFQALLRAFDNGRLWVKLSGGFRIGCDPFPLAKRLLSVGGPEHLVWGSDCPFTDFEQKVTYQSVIDSYHAWVPDATDRATIADVSRKLYRF